MKKEYETIQRNHIPDLKTYRFKREYTSMNNKPEASHGSAGNIINIVNNNRNKSPHDNKIEMNINQFDIKYYVNNGNGNSSSRLMIIGKDKEKTNDKEKSESMVLSESNKTNNQLDKIQHSYKGDSTKSLEDYRKKFVTINENKSINVIFSNDNGFNIEKRLKSPLTERQEKQSGTVELRKRLNRRKMSAIESKTEGGGGDLDQKDNFLLSHRDINNDPKDNFRRLNIRTSSNEFLQREKETPVIIFHRKDNTFNPSIVTTMSEKETMPRIDSYNYQQKKSTKKITIPTISSYNSIDVSTNIPKENSQSFLITNHLSLKHKENMRKSSMPTQESNPGNLSPLKIYNKDNHILRTYSNQKSIIVEEEEKNKTVVSPNSSFLSARNIPLKTQKSLTQRISKDQFHNSLVLPGELRNIQSSKLRDKETKTNESLFSPKITKKQHNNKGSINSLFNTNEACNNPKPIADTINNFFNKRNYSTIPDFLNKKNKGPSVDSQEKNDPDGNKYFNKRSSAGVKLIFQGKKTNQSRDLDDKTKGNNNNKNSNNQINKSLDKTNDSKKIKRQSNRNASQIQKSNAFKKSLHKKRTMIGPNIKKRLSKAFGNNQPIKPIKKLEEENSSDSSHSSSNSSYTQVECERMMIRIFDTIDNVNQLDHMLNASFSYDDIDFNSTQYQNNLRLCQYQQEIVTKKIPTLTDLLLCKKKVIFEKSINQIKMSMINEKLEDFRRNFMSDMINNHDYLKENNEIEEILADDDEKTGYIDNKIGGKLKEKLLSDYLEVTNLAENVFSKKKGLKRLNRGKTRRRTLEPQCIITQADLIKLALEKAENTMFVQQNIQRDILSSLQLDQSPMFAQIKKKKNINFGRATSTPRNQIQRKKTQSRFSKSNTLESFVETINFGANKQIRVSSPSKQNYIPNRKKQNYDFSVVNRMKFNKKHKRKRKTKVPVVSKPSYTKLQRRNQNHFSTSNKDRMLMKTYNLKQKIEQALIDDPYALIVFHIKDGNFNKVDNLLKKGLYNIDIDHRDELGNTFLSIAAQANEYKLCQYFLKKGVNPNIQNNLLLTPLHYALSSKNFDMANLLISFGAAENLVNCDGLNAWQCFGKIL